MKKTFFPPCYKNFGDEKFSPFLQIKKNEEVFFNIPAIEAAINSRWHEAMAYWIRPLGLYAIFLILFAIIPQFYQEQDITEFTQVGIVIFYYIGLYLLVNEFMQIRKYKVKYITIFNLFDLSSIILGMVAFSSLFINIDPMGIIYSVVTLILWIEMVCFMTFGY